MGISTGMTMRLVVLGWLVMAACGDDNAAPKDASGGDDDAAVDAALIDAYECPAVGTAPTCGATTPPTTAAPNGGVTCNPLTQTGCLANEKCAWIVDQQSPRIGHIGCAPNGVTSSAARAAWAQRGPPATTTA
ncbi:MAG: hypothetical protein IPQ07_11785 [Myxococcales bacterium]|nr:hypothetical protein [Myxococcales bacterium]